MYCSRCGTPNADEARFCEKCGLAFGAAAAQPAANAPPAAAAAAAAPVTTPPTAPPPNWQPPSQPYAAPRMRTDAGYSNAPNPNAVAGRRYAVGKTPVVALLLSLFLPAIGQFYNGDAKKGLAMLGGYIVGMILAAIYIGGLVMLGVWVWSMVDAHNVASGKTPLW